MVPRPHVLSLALLLGVGAPLAGCASAAPVAPEQDYRIADGFASRRPADVAVIAVAGGASAEVGALVREASRAALLSRDYAPVRSAEVDRDPGAFRPGGPNAILEIRVLAWDEAALFAAGTVRADAEARLTGPGSADVLYVVRLGAYQARATSRPVVTEEVPLARRQAAADLARKLLERLPAKASSGNQ